jgi:hypothetical protein
MSGLPKKYAKMGFAKGWRAYKAARGHRKGSRKIGGSVKKSSSSKGLRHMFMLDGDTAAPALIQRPIKRIAAITPRRILSPVIDLGLLIAGMAAGATIKKFSPIKNPHIMNGTTILAGVGGSLFFRNRLVKMPLLGIALQSGISEAKILVPNMIPLAGDDEYIYLPMPEGSEQPQLEMRGEDSRVGAVRNFSQYAGQDDSRVGAVYDDVAGDEGEDN